ncbi:TPA: T9SS type A sorting domain-containing protein, partial [bacterium]|nr:T9SS type A sorting domain-containing protein [bacterium]
AVNATSSASGISYQATKLTRGDHTVYVEVADNFGNVGSQSWSFKVEDTPPVIASIEPNGEINTATPVIKATYNDAGTGVNVASVVLSLNGQILPAIATATQVSFEVLNPLSKGVTYKISVQVADKAGNIASKDASFTLETTPPKVSSTKPSGTVSEADASKGVEISAKLADDGSGVNPESVKMWLDGAPVMVNATDASAIYVAKGLSYGEHNVRLVVADMLGNTTDTSWKFSVADTTPPTVTVVSPKQDDIVGVRPVIRISYADEGSGVDLTSIAVKIDDKPVSAGALAPAKPGDAKVVSAGESSYQVALDYGPHTLTVVVKDVAGNEATAEVKFMVEDENLKVIKPHNYPNPFNGNTSIKFVLSKTADVTIRVYDFTGTLVATVVEDEKMTPPVKGIVEVKWDGKTDTGGGLSLATGVYFCQVVAKTESETKSEIIKLALVRN